MAQLMGLTAVAMAVAVAVAVAASVSHRRGDRIQAFLVGFF